MKIEKKKSSEKYYGITLHNNTEHYIFQSIWFETQHERDVVFKHWEKAIEELKASKAVFRPVYEDKDGETSILKLRYTTPEELISVEKARKENFPDTDMKLIMIYNEQERTFQNVNN